MHYEPLSVGIIGKPISLYNFCSIFVKIPVQLARWWIITYFSEIFFVFTTVGSIIPVVVQWIPAICEPCEAWRALLGNLLML